MYKLFEDEGPWVTQSTMATDDSTLVSNTNFNNVENSFLHKIVVRLRLLPYTDLVQWVIDNLSIVDRRIIKKKKIVIKSFSSEDLWKMYHHPEPQCKYEKEYIEAFLKEHGHASKPINGQRKESNKQKREESG